MKIGCIVEGHGEEQAVPLLLRRIVTAWVDPPVSISIPVTLRVQRDRLKRPGELERALELIARRLAGDGGILVLIDAEEDPACQLGPALLGRARAAHGHLPTAVVLATRQFEAWFAAAAESLAGHRYLRHRDRAASALVREAPARRVAPRARGSSPRRSCLT